MRPVFLWYQNQTKTLQRGKKPNKRRQGIVKPWPTGKNQPAICLCKQCFQKTQPHPFMHLLSIAAFMLQWQSWVVVTQITWSAKPQIFTTWLFTEKVCWFPAMDKELSWIKTQKSIRRISKSTKKLIKTDKSQVNLKFIPEMQCLQKKIS